MAKTPFSPIQIELQIELTHVIQIILIGWHVITQYLELMPLGSSETATLGTPTSYMRPSRQEENLQKYNVILQNEFNSWILPQTLNSGLKDYSLEMYMHLKSLQPMDFIEYIKTSSRRGFKLNIIFHQSQLNLSKV